jgi:hypothetical protein
MRAPAFHCLERTLTITNTPPSDVQFSHPAAEQTRSGTKAMHEMAHENLFREPDLAPGTAYDPEAEPAPEQRRRDTGVNTRRPVRRRTGA